MTTEKKQAARTGNRWFGFPAFEGLPLPANPVAANAKLGQAMLANAMAFNQELSRFASQRLAADAGLFATISQCANLNEAVAAQSDFARQAMESYTAEMPKLMEQAVRNTASLWAAASEPGATASQADART